MPNNVWKDKYSLALALSQFHFFLIFVVFLINLKLLPEGSRERSMKGKKCSSSWSVPSLHSNSASTLVSLYINHTHFFTDACHCFWKKWIKLNSFLKDNAQQTLCICVFSYRRRPATKYNLHKLPDCLGWAGHGNAVKWDWKLDAWTKK